MKRRVCYISGTRADYGLMQGTLLRAHRNSTLDVSVCVTGMHLSATYGLTVREIEQAGLRICGRIAVDVESIDGAGMARALGRELLGMVDVLQAERPELVVVMGDRGEMLAGALAAIHLNIPVAHIHGGERSGTVDEPVRHAISKLAHYHFVATDGSRERLIRMGESPGCIFVTGAPGLDGLADFTGRPRAALCANHGFDAGQPVALVVFHPVLQTADDAGREMAAVLDGVLAAGAQILCLMPNSDAGGQAVRGKIAEYTRRPGFQSAVHLGRDDYLAWLAAADVLVGNSSSGIIEAASFGLPVVNVGDRQNGRERNANVTDVPADPAAIRRAVEAALAGGRLPARNIYGDGRAGEQIVGLLSSLPLPQSLLRKSNAY